MRPGRHPEDDPLEQQARARLHDKTHKAKLAVARDQEQTFLNIVTPRRATAQGPKRWHQH